MEKSGKMPVGYCAVYGFDNGAAYIIDEPSETKKSFSYFESLTKREASLGKDSGIVIRSNGVPFLTVGEPFEKWLRAYKMPGHDVFVLEGKDGT
ncbi:MAG: hypothetical protein BWY51_00045 [Parcubacteria group bacterium ADurb.Bin316]|nr:MAG: hypothetical protein BWY51_00045 [Parcubacteria group bacterium ADurb.Bin316]